MANPESVLISYVVRHRDYRTVAKHGVGASMFHIHRKEWDWIERFVARHAKCPGANSFKSRFPEFRVLKTEEGDAEALIHEVQAQHAQFTLKKLLERGADAIDDRGAVDEVLREMHEGLIKLRSEMDGHHTDGDALADSDSAFNYVRNLEIRRQRLGSAGVPTGYATLDERTNGPMAGHLWVVAARLGQGKTWVLVNMAVAAVAAGYKVQFVSLEQPREQILIRAHTIMSEQLSKAGNGPKFSSYDLTSGGVGASVYRKFLRSLPKHYPGSLHISDRGRGQVGPLEVAALIERNKPDIVFIDYLTLMSMAGDDWRAVQKLSGELKTMAMSYEIPVVTAAQVNRAGSSKHEAPGVEHLAYSDSIGQDADAVITLGQLSPSVHRMKMAKFRHGRDGFTWYTKFMPDDGDFAEVTYDEAMDLKDADDDYQP